MLKAEDSKIKTNKRLFAMNAKILNTTN